MQRRRETDRPVFGARRGNGDCALTFETGKTIALPQVMSADGGRYADKGVEFWIKGKSATLNPDGDNETCSTK